MSGETPIGKFIGKDALVKQHEETRKNIEKSNKDAKITINKDSKPEVKVTVSKKWIEKAGLSEKGGLAAIRNFLKEQTKHDTSSDDGFVKAITEYQEKHKKDKKLTADGILGWKTLEVMEQEMESEKNQDKYQGDNPEMDSEHVLTQAEYDAKNEEKTEKLTNIQKAIDDQDTEGKYDLDGNPLIIKNENGLKYATGKDGKVFDTKTGTYSEQTEEQVLAENKTKSEKEATQKKIDGLLSSIDATITESEPSDTNDVIQKFLSQIPENGLSESQLAHLNNSLKEKGFKIAPYNDADHYANGIQSHYFVEETGFGAKKDYEDQLAKIESLGNDPKNYLDWSVEGKGDGKTGLLKNKTLGELTPELVNGKDNSSMPEQVRKEILALVDITKNNSELKKITFQEYLETIKDPNKAALALAPTDKAGVLLGNLGKWGAKYQKNAEGLTIALHEGEKVPKIVTKKGEVSIREYFKNKKDGSYTLPNEQQVRIATNNDGIRTFRIAEKSDDTNPKWVLNEEDKLEEIKRAV